MRKAEQYKPIGEGRAARQDESHAAGEGPGKAAIESRQSATARHSGEVAIESRQSATARHSGEVAIDELKNEVLSPLERDMEKLRDPFVLAAIMNTAANERENTNRLLKTIIERLDAKFMEMEGRIAALEAPQAVPAAPSGEEILLPQVDEEIVRFVKEKRHATAEEVRARFSYKGKNAASARLNRLYEMGLLGKRQVGRAVLFFAKP